MNIRIRNLIKRFGLFALSAAVVMVSALPQEAAATHWRGGNISWTPNTSAPANTIDFTITSFWRTTFFFPNLAMPPTNGVSTFNPFTFDFGAGEGTASGAGTVVTSQNVAGDWMSGVTTLTHTYGGAGPFTASLSSCCRISSLANNPNGNFRIESIVNADGSSSNPNTNSTSPIFLLPFGGPQAFTPVNPTDPDAGDTFTYALATSAMAGPGHTQPNTMAIGLNSGLVTIDTSAANGYVVGQLYSNQIVVTDSQGNTTATDFIYQLCTPGTTNCGGFVPPTVPEPGTLALMAVALLGVGGLARRKQRPSNRPSN